MSHSSTSTLPVSVVTTLAFAALPLHAEYQGRSSPRTLTNCWFLITHPTFLTSRRFKFAQQSPPSPQIHPKCARGAQTWVPMSPPSGMSQIYPYFPPPTLSILAFSSSRYPPSAKSSSFDRPRGPCHAFGSCEARRHRLEPMDLRRSTQATIDRVEFLSSHTKTIAAITKGRRGGCDHVEDEIEIVEGIRFDHGYISSLTPMPNGSNSTSPSILLSEKMISLLQDIPPSLETIAQACRQTMAPVSGFRSVSRLPISSFRSSRLTGHRSYDKEVPTLYFSAACWLTQVNIFPSLFLEFVGVNAGKFFFFFCTRPRLQRSLSSF